MFRARALMTAWVLCHLCSPSIQAQEAREVSRSKATPMLSPELRERLSTSEAVRVWVYFTDKNTGGTSEGLELALRNVGPTLSPRALAKAQKRRLRFGIEDVPVCERYVEGVLGTGATLRHRLRWLNAVSAVATARQVEAIARLPFVASLDVVRGRPMARIDAEPEESPGETLRSMESGTDPTVFYGLTFPQYDKLQIDDAHAAGYTGTDVTIAMFDSGFDRRHPVFHATRLIAEHDFVQDDDVTWDQPTLPDDYPDTDCQMGHGTSTWSCTGGYYPGKMVGVAFGADFALAKTEYNPTETHPEEDNWAAAAEWAFTTVGADIVSSSLGYRYQFTEGGSYSWEQLDGKTTIVARAANEATERGILIVNSAGNEGNRSPGQRTIISPADSNSVLAIGAILIGAETRADFSSQGPCAPSCASCPEKIKPDVMAPGQSVFGAIAQGGVCGTFSEDDPYILGLAGTSFSCPIAAGSAALVLEAHPSWTPYEVRRAMKESTKERQIGVNPSVAMGWGVLRVKDAIDFEFPSPPVLPLPFDLVSPVPFSQSGQGISDLTPEFVWTQSLPGQIPLASTYTLELASDFEFSSPERFVGSADTTFTPPAPLAEGFYYWRVTAAPTGTPGIKRESRERSRILIDFSPTVASVVFPAQDDSLTDNLTPTFVWRRSQDATPGETLTYRLSVSPTDDFGTGTQVYDGLSDTTLTIPTSESLDERHSYFCRVDVTDHFGAVTRSDVVFFHTGIFPPQPFSLSFPAEDDTVAVRRPTLTWTRAEDLYVRDSITYEVYIGATKSSLFRARQGLAEPTWQVDQGRLVDDTSYFWTAVAVDLFGARTASPDTLPFHVRTAPLPFALTGPPDEEIVYTGRPTFRWAAAEHDLPTEVMTYTLRVFSDESRKNAVLAVPDLSSLSVQISDPLPEGTYYWDVVAEDSRGRQVASTQSYAVIISPAPAVLGAKVAPNPFAPRAGEMIVTYDVPQSAAGQPLTIDIHDVMGRVVRRLVDGLAAPGAAFETHWDGRAGNGARLPAGVYYVQIGIAGETRSERVVLLGR